VSDYQDDPELAKRMQAREERIKQEEETLKNAPTIAARLTAFALEKKVKIKIPQGNKEVEIEFYEPLAAEFDQIVEIRMDIREALNANDRPKVKQLNDQLYQIIGRLCCDKELDYKYWSSGQYATGLFPTVVEGLVSEVIRQAKEAVAFQSK
jgi:hypothetical protein